jgi:hypothetical protein
MLAPPGDVREEGQSLEATASKARLEPTRDAELMREGRALAAIAWRVGIWWGIGGLGHIGGRLGAEAREVGPDVVAVVP